MPLEVGLGPARVIAIEDPAHIEAAELRRHRPRRGERLLLRTRNSDQVWQAAGFVKQFVAFSLEGAEYLAGCRPRLVGVDYLSVGTYHGDGPEVHRALLGAGIWIVEGLDLSRVAPGDYELACLPLRIEGGDGAPARAALRRV
jgi:arylformamidase